MNINKWPATAEISEVTPEIPMLLDVLEETATDVMCAVTDLLIRISPILVASPEEADEDRKPEARSPMGRSLETIQVNLAVALKHLRAAEHNLSI